VRAVLGWLVRRRDRRYTLSDDTFAHHVDLSGRAAVVTGASRGLGRQIALALARHGADVVAASRSASGLDETADQIFRETQREALVVTTDVSSPQDVANLKTRATSKFGHIAILANVAGVFGPLAPFSQTDPHEWIRTLETNTMGTYLTCRSFVPEMIEAGWGRIVNVSSAAALTAPRPLDSAYSTSKSAVNRLTRHLAAELADTGVTANVIHPGSFESTMWEDIRSQLGLLTKQGECPAAWTDEFRQLGELVRETGGDPISRATSLIINLLDGAADEINGTFCWADGALEEPGARW
jgi:NAD(P)-dependent dehydrogenase (short-subunit alcohol dehydrogenase family)